METTIATASLYLAFIIIILLKFITRPMSKKGMLPEPWRLPIIGHMHHLIGTLPHRGTMQLAKKYGSLMHLQLGEVSTIVVTSPRWAKEVLTTSDIMFANRPETLTGEIIAYHNTDIIFSPYSEYWRQLRKLCTLELLSVKKVKTFSSLREEECWKFVGNIRSLGKSGSPINLSENIFLLIATILGREAFGEGFKEQKASVEMLHQIGKLTGGFDVADMFPTKKFLHHLSGKRGKLTKLHNQVDHVINGIISERPAYRTSSSQECLIDVLLRLKESEEFPLTLDSVKAVIVDVFSAGTDSSSATIEWAISELIRCPRAMEKLQKELRQALNGKERIQEEDIIELSYLKAVIKETLRLHPPLAMALPRECREPCVLGGYEIPVKTKLIVNVFAINRDPEYWQDAETFMPERFENSSINVMGSEYEYLPFGGGRRMCPAYNLGFANMELPLATLLYYFNWNLPNGKCFEELDMNESFGVAVKRKTDLLLVPTEFKTVDVST